MPLRSEGWPGGCLVCSPFGRNRFLRWEEIRLWEVDRQGEGRRFRLYGTTSGVGWNEVAPSKLVSLGGPTPEAFHARHQEALALIVARTQLLPRTLDQELAVKEQRQRFPQSNARAEPVWRNEES